MNLSTNANKLLLGVGAAALLVGWLVNCSSSSSPPADFCKTLLLEEVMSVRPAVTGWKMVHANADNPDLSYWACVWKSNARENELQLSVSYRTSNSPEDILKVFVGENGFQPGHRIVGIRDVGDDAAVTFYKRKEDNENRFTLWARDATWSVDMRSHISGDENGEEFKKMAGLAAKALARMNSEKEFAHLRK